MCGSVAVATLLLAGVAGWLRIRSRPAAVAVLLLLTGLAGAAAVLRPSAGTLAWLPALVAAVVGIMTLEFLVGRTGVIAPGTRASAAQPTRRGLLALGGVGAAVAALGGAGQALAARRATRNPFASWSDYWRHYAWLLAGVWVGVLLAIGIASLWIGPDLIDLI